MGKTLKLQFDPDKAGHRAVGKDISALAVAGRTLFCASDETADIERLVFDPDTGDFGQHQKIVLADYFNLPAGTDEMDIEGLAVDQDRLWVTGSHSLKRNKLDPNAKLDALNQLKWDANRSFLGYLPLHQVDVGLFLPASPMVASNGLSPSRMMKTGRKRQNGLRRFLRSSNLLEPFMHLPAKENGFEVEGLAILRGRALIGLRGPVLGQHAMIISIEFKETASGFLKPRKINGKRYRLHAIDLGGFGIRDLLVQGDELLVLAGPTQAIEGVARIYSLRGFSPDEEIITRDRLTKIATLPMREECDHAEGIASFAFGGKTQLLVAYDNPAPNRLDKGEHHLLLDVLQLAED